MCVLLAFLIFFTSGHTNVNNFIMKLCVICGIPVNYGVIMFLCMLLNYCGRNGVEIKCVKFGKSDSPLDVQGHDGISALHAFPPRCIYFLTFVKFVLSE